MKFNINITSVQSIHSIPNYWASKDYIGLLEAFETSDIDEIEPSDLEEMLELVLKSISLHSLFFNRQAISLFCV